MKKWIDSFVRKQVSENLLQVYLDEYPETPWDSLKYLIAGVCYGGHVTDDWDRRLLMTYVQQYFTDEALTVPNYRLSSLPTYYIPKDGSLGSYLDFIAVLPAVDKPEAFGQHPNADITCLIMETRNMFETLMELQVQTVTKEEVSKEEKVCSSNFVESSFFQNSFTIYKILYLYMYTHRFFSYNTMNFFLLFYILERDQ